MPRFLLVKSVLWIAFFDGATLSSQGHVWRMAPETVDATITVGQKRGVEVREQEMTSFPDEMSIPPFSVSIYSFTVQ